MIQVDSFFSQERFFRAQEKKYPTRMRNGKIKHSNSKNWPAIDSFQGTVSG